MNESEKLTKHQVRGIILEEIGKAIVRIKKENNLSTLDILYDSDSFYCYRGIFQEEVEDEDERVDFAYNVRQLKTLLASFEDSFKKGYYKDKGCKGWWIFYNQDEEIGQRFEIKTEYEVKDLIKKVLNNYFLYSCGNLISCCFKPFPRLNFVFDFSFIDKIFEDVYNFKEKYYYFFGRKYGGDSNSLNGNKFYDDGSCSLKAYLDKIMSEVWLPFLKDFYWSDNDWNAKDLCLRGNWWNDVKHSVKNDIVENTFYFNADKKGKIYITTTSKWQMTNPKNND